MKVGAALRLELAKFRASRRNLLFLLLPNLYPVLASLGMVAVLATRSVTGFRAMGAALFLFLAFHAMNGLVVYPLALMLRSTELWAGEETDGTLRTLVLTQAPRGAVLAAKVGSTLGMALAAHAVFFGTFLANVWLMRSFAPPHEWAKVMIGLAQAASNLAVYSLVLALGFMALALFFAWVASLASRATTVALLSAVIVMMVWWITSAVLGLFDVATDAGRLVFADAYVRLFGLGLLQALVLGREAALAPLGGPARVLAASCVVLAGLCWTTWRRKQFLD